MNMRRKFRLTCIIWVLLFAVASCSLSPDPSPGTTDPIPARPAGLDEKILKVDAGRKLEDGGSLVLDVPEGKSVYTLTVCFPENYNTSAENDDYETAFTLKAEYPGSRSLARTFLQSSNEVKPPDWTDVGILVKDEPEESEWYYTDAKGIYTDETNRIRFYADDSIYEEENPLWKALIAELKKSPNPLATELLVKERRMFGLNHPTDTDKDGYFRVLIHSFGEQATTTNGWFRASDLGNYSKSNHSDMVYFNYDVLERNFEYLGIEDTAEKFASTIAHEYFHYLQRDFKERQGYRTKNTMHFFSEGGANYAALSATGKVIGSTSSNLLSGIKLMKTYHPLTQDGKLANYGVGAMMMSYMEEKFGSVVVERLVKLEGNMVQPIEEATGISFTTLYRDFVFETFSAIAGEPIGSGRAAMTFPETYELRKDIDRVLTEFDGKTYKGHLIDYKIPASKISYTSEIAGYGFVLNYFEEAPETITFSCETQDSVCYVLYMDAPN